MSTIISRLIRGDLKPAVKDLFILGVIAVVVLIVSVALDVFDRFVHWYVQQEEPYEIEEIIVVIFVLSFGFGVYSWRRWRESGREVDLREGIEKDLRRESSFREAVIAAAGDGICVWHAIEEHPYMRFTVWNPCMKEITGYSVEEINRIGWAEALYDRPLARAFVLEALKGLLHNQPWPGSESIIRRADGQMRTVVASSSRIQSLEGQSHVVIMLRDITEQKEMERSLRESEAKFRSLVDSIRVGILIVQDDRIVYQNPTQEHLLGGGLSPPFPLKRLIEEIHPDDRRGFVKHYESARSQRSSASGVTLRLVSKGEGKDDRIRWTESACTPITYRGRVASLIHMRDITHLKSLERMVVKRERMVALGHLAASIAHEIRNPLSGINVYLGAIRDCYEDPECTEDVPGLIREALATSNKIESVMRRVLELARPSEPRMEPTSINDAILKAVELASSRIQNDSILLDLKLQPGLPEVGANRQHIEQVILALINNAIDALGAVEGERRIRVSTRVKDGYLNTHVEDNGPVIPEDLREKAIEPFFPTQRQGMDIGLGICKQIITDHGGFIHISPSSIGGSQFTVRIPLDKVDS